MHVITAASSNHFRPLLNLLASYEHHMPASKSQISVYDLGLSDTERASLMAGGWNVIPFSFNNRPLHLNPHLPEGEGSCAWKPVLVWEATRYRPVESALWLDAGCLLHGSLAKIETVLKEVPVYTPKIGYSIERWGHPETLDWLDPVGDLRKLPCHYGGVCGFSPDGWYLLEKLKNVCLDQSIIRPPGWAKTKHRSDQIVLSILLHRYARVSGYRVIDEKLDVSVLNDWRTAEQARKKFLSDDLSFEQG